MIGVFFDLLKICISHNDVDSVNLSSTHHYPSGKNSGLLSGSYWCKALVLNPGLPVQRALYN